MESFVLVSEHGSESNETRDMSEWVPMGIVFLGRGHRHRELSQEKGETMG